MPAPIPAPAPFQFFKVLRLRLLKKNKIAPAPTPDPAKSCVSERSGSDSGSPALFETSAAITTETIDNKVKFTWGKIWRNFVKYDLTLIDHILEVRTTLTRNFRPSWTSLYRWKKIYFRSPFTRFSNRLIRLAKLFWLLFLVRLL